MAAVTFVVQQFFKTFEIFSSDKRHAIVAIFWCVRHIITP